MQRVSLLKRCGREPDQYCGPRPSALPGSGDFRNGRSDPLAGSPGRLGGAAGLMRLCHLLNHAAGSLPPMLMADSDGALVAMKRRAKSAMRHIRRMARRAIRD
jgi:hypothetical protein